MYDIITFGSATRDIMVKPKKLTGLKFEKHEAQIVNPLFIKPLVMKNFLERCLGI